MFAQLEGGGGIPCVGGFLEQAGGRGRILGHALTGLIHFTQQQHGRYMTAARRTGQQGRAFARISGQPRRAIKIELPQQNHRLPVVCGGGFMQPVHRACRIGRAAAPVQQQAGQTGLRQRIPRLGQGQQLCAGGGVIFGGKGLFGLLHRGQIRGQLSGLGMGGTAKGQSRCKDRAKQGGSAGRDHKTGFRLKGLGSAIYVQLA